MPRLCRVRFLESLPYRQQPCLGYAERPFIRAGGACTAAYLLQGPIREAEDSFLLYGAFQSLRADITAFPPLQQRYGPSLLHAPAYGLVGRAYALRVNSEGGGSGSLVGLHIYRCQNGVPGRASAVGGYSTRLQRRDNGKGVSL